MQLFALLRSGARALLGRAVPNISPEPESCGTFVRALSENDKDEIKPVDFFLFDITGGVFEYQITEPLGPNSTHSKARCVVLLRPRLWAFLILPSFLMML